MVVPPRVWRPLVSVHASCVVVRSKRCNRLAPLLRFRQLQMGRKRLKVAHKKEKGTYDAPGSRGGDMGGMGGGAGPAGELGGRPDGSGLTM